MINIRNKERHNGTCSSGYRLLKSVGIFTLVAFVMCLLSSCSVSEDKIIGTWGGYYCLDEYGNGEVVAVTFESDHTGKMIVSSKTANIGVNAALCVFHWEIDDYMVKLSGEYNDGDEDKSFSVQFRYKDGRLECKDYLPGGYFNGAISYQHTCTLTKR